MPAFLISPRLLRLLASLGLSLLLAACSSPEGPSGENVTAQGWWIGHRVSGPPKIEIDLNRQIVRYYKGGQLVGAAPVSSGREGHGTVTGTYRITEKDADHRSSCYGSFVDDDGSIVEGDVDSRRDRPPPGTRFLGASMRHFMRIKGGIGMHEGYLPGFAASHGCIRLPSKMAAIFYDATPLGTPVEIIGDAPDGHLTTFLPVPHKLSKEDIIIAPKDDSTAHRPAAQVALDDPAAKKEEKKAEKTKTAEPKVLAKNDKPSFWGGLFGGGADKEANDSKPAPRYGDPVVATNTEKPAEQVKPAIAAAKPEVQQISYQPLEELGPKGSAKKSTPKPKVLKTKGAQPAARGQTLFLPGYN